MSKIFKLYQNEIIKTSRKAAIIVLGALLIAVPLLINGIFKANEALTENLTNTEHDMFQYTEEGYSYNISEAENNIIVDKAALTQTTDEAEIESINKRIEQETATIDFYNLLTANKISQDNSYRYNAANAIYQNALALIELEDTQPEQAAALQQKNQQLLQIITGKNFSAWIDYLNGEIAENPNYSEEEKQIRTECNELRKKYSDGNTAFSVDAVFGATVESKIDSIEKYRLMLLTNKKSVYIDTQNTVYIDYTDEEVDLYKYQPAQDTAEEMTQDEREDVKNKLAVAVYQLENNEAAASNTSLTSTAHIASVKGGINVMIILLIVLAGSAISSEISTGSIKTLIISPTKRWKIMTAKILSLLTIFILSALVLWGVSLASLSLMFGAPAMQPYVYATSGVVHAIPFAPYLLCYILVSGIDVLFFLFLALMLSTLTKNTGLSVGVSIALFFVGPSVSSVLKLLTNSKWLNYIPFVNLSLQDRIFSSSTIGNIASEMAAGGMYSLPSVLFSSIYLAIFAAAIIAATYLVFTKRDIK